MYITYTYTPEVLALPSCCLHIQEAVMHSDLTVHISCMHVQYVHVHVYVIVARS